MTRKSLWQYAALIAIHKNDQDALNLKASNYFGHPPSELVWTRAIAKSATPAVTAGYIAYFNGLRWKDVLNIVDWLAPRYPKCDVMVGIRPELMGEVRKLRDKYDFELYKDDDPATRTHARIRIRTGKPDVGDHLALMGAVFVSG